MNARNAILAVIGAGLAASAASADTVKVKFTGTGLGRTVRLIHDGSTTNLFAGQLKHTFTNPVGPIAQHIVGDLLTFCTDLSQYVTSTAKTYNVVPLSTVPGSPGMGPDKAQAIKNMYAFAHDSQFATSDTSNNKDLAAAFQMAVWEIVYDFQGVRSSLSAASGDIQFKNTSGGALSSGITTHLNNLFNAAMVDGAHMPLMAVSNDSYQDQIVQLNFVPLPGAAAMATLGLLGTMGVRRRR